MPLLRVTKNLGWPVFLAGLQSAKQMVDQQNASLAATAGQVAPRLDILYGSQTGNAEGIAMDAANVARSQGFNPVVQGMDDVSIEDFAQMEKVIFSVATYGEGEMPDNAELFWQSLSASDMPKLPDMKFGVLALGDTGYDEFCQAGKLIDMRLEQLGATRLVDRVDCDVDFEDMAEEWINTTIPLANDGDAIATVIPLQAESAVVKSIWNRKNPYPATVTKNLLLSAEGSAKEIRHFEIDLGDSGLSYEVGDALNVIPVNDASLVESLLAYFSLSGDTVLEGQERTLGELLTYKYEISTPSKELIAAVEKIADHDAFSHVFKNGDKEALADFLWAKDILDLLQLTEKVSFTVEEFLGLLAVTASSLFDIF